MRAAVVAKQPAGTIDRKAVAAQKKADALSRRRTQLEECEAFSGQADVARRAGIDATRRHAALADHAQAFYIEIDKLAKKQPNMPVSDLIVESINDIIRDAKLLVQGDPHLDRIKEFVPAGNNPSHSDVLLKTKLVRSAVGRGKQFLTSHVSAQAVAAEKAEALAYILRSIVRNDTPPTKSDLETTFGDRTFFSEWFGDDDEFDLAFLDENGVAKFMADDDDDTAGDDEDGSQDE
jgi:hypothetical protein